MSKKWVLDRCLGMAVGNLLKIAGYDVILANLVNDRGIHICKSMVAWLEFGNGETPATTVTKGDHFVGEYYVLFENMYRAQVAQLVESGMEEEEAKAKAPILLQAESMLRQWEGGNEQVVELWKTMNSWVYEGFEQTYRDFGFEFDKFYFESQTYLLGRDIVRKGLKDGVFADHDGTILMLLPAEKFGIEKGGAGTR